MSNASEIEMFGTKTTLYTPKNHGVSYVLNAKYYVLNIDAIRKEYRFFNRKAVAKKYHYRQEGDFQSKNINLNFERAYKYDGNFIFENATFRASEDLLRVKECSYGHEKLTCKKIKYLQNNTITKTRLNETFYTTLFSNTTRKH